MQVKSRESTIMFLRSGTKVKFGGGEAFYSQGDDYIQMLPKTDFKSAEGYYSTFLHELVHFTGHPSRLDCI